MLVQQAAPGRYDVLAAGRAQADDGGRRVHLVGHGLPRQVREGLAGPPAASLRLALGVRGGRREDGP